MGAVTGVLFSGGRSIPRGSLIGADRYRIGADVGGLSWDQGLSARWRCEDGGGASWWWREDGGGAILLRQCRGDWGFAVGCGRGLGVGVLMRVSVGVGFGLGGFWLDCLVFWFRTHSREGR